MEKTLKHLTPIEKLFLISKEREDIYTKKNKTFCLLYSLVSNNSLSFKNNNKFKVNYNTKIFPNDYEIKALDLIGENKMFELNTFIDKELIFNKTLIGLGIFQEQIKVKKRLFFKTASTEIIKTTLYHKLQGNFSEQLENRVNVVRIVCNDTDQYNKTNKAYSILKLCMKKAQEDAAKEIAKKKEEKKNK